MMVVIFKRDWEQFRRRRSPPYVDVSANVSATNVHIMLGQAVVEFVAMVNDARIIERNSSFQMLLY